MSQTELSLTQVQLAAVSNLFTRALQNPDLLLAFLDDPDKALQASGMEDRNIAEIGEFFYQFKSRLRETLVKYDPW